MSFRNNFYAIDDNNLELITSRDELFKLSELVGDCSHYLAAHPDIKEFFDHGEPIKGLTHQFVQPNYRYSTEIPHIRDKVKTIIDIECKDDNWSANELSGFIKACDFAILHKKGLVSLLNH